MITDSSSAHTDRSTGGRSHWEEGLGATELPDGRVLTTARFGPPPMKGAPVVVFEAGAFGFYGDGVVICRSFAAKGITAITYTRSGLYGSSPLPKGETPTPAFHADDLHALLGANGIDGPILLIGHSMGGLRARAFAQKWPERVAGLILLDAVAPAQITWNFRRELVRAGMSAMGKVERVAGTKLGRRAMRHYPPIKSYSAAARSDRYGSWTSPQHLAGTRAEILAVANRAVLPTLALPQGLEVLVITATPIAWGARAEAGLENASRIHLPRTGHAQLLHGTTAERVAGLIEEWAVKRDLCAIITP